MRSPSTAPSPKVLLRFVKGTFGKKYTTVSFSAGPLLLARNTLMCSSLLRFFKGTFGNKYTTVSFSAGPLLLARNTLMCSSLLRSARGGTGTSDTFFSSGALLFAFPIRTYHFSTALVLMWYVY
ncbi:uncharacterized protein [Triticum aestivum]|uniref:uncharacterized protein isoform X2 n=1 Tax=Triticum aestivum TaxID=4565 RepID=UPI001D020C1D|nr:uncharacterized protein LOC123182677 isoform X2 [Triticum aestivum]